ncbi:hypothetical protein LOTGIDRAFT_144404 [Lottia gigantea]|uniref:Uncharacterized protein n=1 Tax=Lottia gigantea TaxID=225164 RepID=V4AMC1_LOTGI|nr:hypothetical protein LOTGIDRAFT_144404 [Lottia gigantea]ESO95890.1 hypothetical protein LOTGIDRAFT_144404 [Lottia gigantea]
MAGLEIHEAAATGDHEALEDFLKTKKFNVNLKDVEYHKKTALHWACARGYSECVRILLDYGAKGTSRTDEGWTPAHSAAEAGRTAALRALHTANIPVNRKDKYGDKPRRIAVIYGHAETVKYLAQ